MAFDGDLREEFLTAEWQADLESSLKRLIEKRVHRKKLGRSPDRADALAYCLFEGRIEPASAVTAELRAERKAEELRELEAPPPKPVSIYDAADMGVSGSSPYDFEDSVSAGGSDAEPDDVDRRQHSRAFSAARFGTKYLPPSSAIRATAPRRRSWTTSPAGAARLPAPPPKVPPEPERVWWRRLLP